MVYNSLKLNKSTSLLIKMNQILRRCTERGWHTDRTEQPISIEILMVTIKDAEVQIPQDFHPFYLSEEQTLYLILPGGTGTVMLHGKL